MPFHEDADLVLGPTTKGRWSYAASKALDEFLALSYWKERKQPVIIARFFNTVGPRQTGRYGMVLPNFVRQALEGSPITVYGTGKQSRCFCDVRDTVEAILRLVANDRAVGEVVNIGSDEEISIEGLARVVKERTNSDSPITYMPYDQAYEPGFEDMPRRVPSLEKLAKPHGLSSRDAAGRNCGSRGRSLQKAKRCETCAGTGPVGGSGSFRLGTEDFVALRRRFFRGRRTSGYDATGGI